jgi:hypothetical protein
VTETPFIADDSRSLAQSTVNGNVADGPLPLEQGPSAVNAAYWQARSVISDDSTTTRDSTVNVDVAAERPTSEPRPSSVYATFWQARSGRFNSNPKPGRSHVDFVKGSRQ